MRKLCISCLIIITCLSSSCKKDDSPAPTLAERMPGATQVGAEKLLAIIDGEYIFENNYLQLFSPSMYSWYTSQQGYLHIDAYHYFYVDNLAINVEEILIKMYDVTGLGEHQITPDLGVAYFSKGGATYQTDSIHTGNLIVTVLDTANNIYSGTFDINLIDYESNETIHISNGWFDISD